VVHEIGRGRDVTERSLEMTEVSRGGGRRWWRQESGLEIFSQNDAQKSISSVF